MSSHGLLSLIGNTPIIKLSRIKVKPSVELWVKIESFNPGGSVKDRPALFMIESAEKQGQLTKDKIVIEASSGNTGIGLALVCTLKGYKCMIAMAESASIERRKIMQAFGAEILLTPAEKGTDGAIERVYELIRNEPDKYFCPDQYTNPANWQAHFFTTAPEIWRDTQGKVTHVVCGLGTTGTAMGIARFFKEKAPRVKVIGVEPNPGHKIQGLKNMKESYPPSIFDRKLLEKVVNVDDEEAFYWTRWLAKNEGIFAGMSSGAALAGALKVAETLEEGLIVVILPDGGERYLSTPLWSLSTAKSPKDKAVVVITNTFSGKREEFVPDGKKVKIYSCGPTLDDSPHIGIYRRLLTVDVLKSFLKLQGYSVRHILNLTDFDDRTIQKALSTGKPLSELTKEFKDLFLKELNILKFEPAEEYPCVSEYLEDMKDLALRLLEEGKAYEKFSSIYFDISRLEDYGALAKIEVSRLKPGATIELEYYDKEEPFDFALLKRVQLPELKHGYFVETPFGKVRPTWHIHCATLLLKFFEGKVDMFTSSQDLVFPHHENTRAVIKALTGKEPAKIWLHTGLVFYNGKKLSSENKVTLKDLLNKGFTPRTLRFYFLRTHYRNPFNFSWKGLEESKKILSKIDRYIALLEACPVVDKATKEVTAVINDFKHLWKEAIKEDLNTPVSVSELISFFKRLYPFLKTGLTEKEKEEAWNALEEFNQVLKFLRFPDPNSVKDDEVIKKLELRSKAREEKNYELADKIREELEKAGYFVFDFSSVTKAVKLKDEN